jgi:tetratricopeptide (TPR) repeat protein
MRSPPCPSSEAWAVFAAGLCARVEEDALLAHAADCKACAARLRNLVAAVEPVADPDDARPPVEGLATESAAYRRELALKLARPPRQTPNRWWIPVAAVLAVGLGIAGWQFERVRTGPPLAELARAYSSSRTLELRIPGAAYAPLRLERGGRNLGDLPPALLESQARIRQHLDRQAASAGWLHAQGRAALLGWDVDTALRSFQAASELHAQSSDFLVDFGIAYFERAETNQSARDYALALEKLGEALQAEPGNLAALFNRAVVNAKLYNYDLAIADFEEYLRREQDPGWRDEARRRLDEVRKRRASVFPPGHPPPSDLSDEFGLEAAMTGGLSRGLRGPQADLAAQASALSSRHGDPWLLEASRLRPTPEWSWAVDTLSGMAEKRALAGTGAGLPAEEAQRLAAARLPLPLRVWRDYELLYRTTRTAAVGNCPEIAGAPGRRPTYPWFAAQTLLEASLCAAGRQDFAAAAASVGRAAALAEAHHFPGILIRVPNFQAQRLVDTGFHREAIQTATGALARMEAGGYPVRRAYDFYAIIQRAATHLGLPHTAHGAASMMAAIGRAANARLFEMVGEFQRAQYAATLGRVQEAEQAYSAAERAFAALRDDPGAAAYRRVARAGWLELHRDRAALYRLLDEARAESRGTKENLYFNRRLIAALCRLELREGNTRAVASLAEPFWAEIDGAAARQPGTLRAYAPEVESVARSLAAAYVQAGDAAAGYSAWLRYAGLRARMMGGAEPAAGGAQVEGAVTLTVAALNGRAALWQNVAGRLDFRWASCSYNELAESARRLRRMASAAVTAEPDIEAGARALFVRLFPNGTAGARHVYIAAEGDLNAVPLSLFSQLPEGKGAAFSFLPLGGGLPPRRPRPDRVTIVAASVFNRSLGPLARIGASLQEEVEGVESAFQHRRLLAGESATGAALDEAAARPEVLHFAGHAIPWGGSIGLAVAPDPAAAAPGHRAGVWTLAPPQRIKAPLAVFSACRTAEYNEPGSVQPGQLAEAALVAGAEEAVATLWDVDTAATAAWAKAFYAELTAERTTPEAVEAAVRRVRLQTQWRHPRYWAGFAAYGSGMRDGPTRVSRVARFQ